MFGMSQDGNTDASVLVDTDSTMELYSGSMPDRHLMCDIETLDVNEDAAIVQIAACTFDPRKDGSAHEEEWSCTISRESNQGHGREVSQSTLDWWSQQSAEARAAVFNGPHQTLPLALTNFCSWANRLRPTCTTAMEMAYPEGDFPRVHVEGAEHDAIVDVKKQILEIQHAYFVLGC